MGNVEICIVTATSVWKGTTKTPAAGGNIVLPVLVHDSIAQTCAQAIDV